MENDFLKLNNLAEQIDKVNSEKRYDLLKFICSTIEGKRIFWKEMLFKVIDAKNDENKLKEISDYLAHQVRLISKQYWFKCYLAITPITFIIPLIIMANINQ